MEDYKIPTDDELYELAADYIESLNDEDFPSHPRFWKYKFLYYTNRILMSKIRELVNNLLKRQEEKVNSLIASDSEDIKEFDKLIYLKEVSRELDYLEDIAKKYD